MKDPEQAREIINRFTEGFPEHPVTRERVAFNPKKIAIEIHDTRKHNPKDAPRLYKRALEKVRTD